ncbi:MAG: glutamate--tRNA ligase family protein [Candidatus Pacearchaeota archaeon]
MEFSKEKIKAYALKNAIQHEGSPNQGSVISALFNEGLEKDKVKEVIPTVQEVIGEVKNTSLEEQEKEFKNLKELISERQEQEGLPELPDPENGIITRFAPSASGPLHVAHALTACLAFDYVREYGGRFYFRVEDTNPENVYEPAYDLLKKEADWLFQEQAIFSVQSDNIEKYYQYIEELLKSGSAYVCTCDPDEFKKLLSNKKECPCRSISPEENLDRWHKMQKEFKQGNAVLRFKSDLTHKNPAMRDFPLARINDTEHPRQGKKYRVWPLMNLAVTVDDIESGMTHIIRAKDHRDNAERQKLIYKALGLEEKIPHTYFLGRWHFTDLEMSTSKFKQGIQEGKYCGWDDPKLPTIESLKNQGYRPEAFWKLSEHFGLKESDKTIESKEFFRLLDQFSKEAKN